MQYPTEYVTALITISAALMALAGVIIAVVSTRDDKGTRDWSIAIIITSLVSMVFGFFAMVKGLAWFDQATSNLVTTSRNFLALQFASVFLPLFWYSIIVWNSRRKARNKLEERKPK